MAFQQGLSGLNAASKSLDVISNNVANSGNVGFKSGSTLFNDVYAAALNGSAAGVQVGIGTAVGAVSQQFSQGNITPTNNPLDLAINGNGFFRMSGQGAIAYTRNGQFDVDKDGFITSASGYRLNGHPADATGKILSSVTQELKIDTTFLPLKATTSIGIGLNLDSGETPPATATFSTTDPTSYNVSTSVTVFDSLGNPQILSLYFVKASTPANTWEFYGDLDGAGATQYADVTFSTSGVLTSGGTQTLSSPAGVALDFAGTTQYAGDFAVNAQSQDGYTSGRLAGVTIGTEGVMQGRYSNGQTRDLGQVVLVNFASPNGLLSLGNNLWGESPDSGQPLLGDPGSGSLGLLTSGAIEESNVDLTAELVNMITQQRAYQANAQSIRTQDEVLQTLVNL
ncbi:MAG: flagellar hook protein FlgE [Anaerolineae bacterium]|nr:flagellar hook protein FlgE [Anaerolineae bacterium]